jgi:hypothetical protein
VTGPVTALGIRDGDTAVLRALIARRGSAVLAYCERACAPGQVPEAAAEAFAQFRALVVASPRPADLDPEAALLSATRHAAAHRAPRGQPPPSGAGLGRLLAGRPTADQITLVPELLIARADGTLDAGGEEQLNRLLDASAAARAAEERFRTAEHAYRSAPPRPLPPEIVDHIVAAMVAVPGAVELPAAADEPRFVAEEPPPPPPVVEEPPPPVAEEEPPPPPPVAAEEPPPPPPEEDAGAAEHPAPPPPAGAVSAGDLAPAQSAEAPIESNEGAVVAEEPPQVADPDPVNGAGGPTVEWDVPPEQAGPQETFDTEIAAARLPGRDDEVEDDDGPGDPPVRRPPTVRPPPPQRAAAATQTGSVPKPPGPPASRSGLPGKGALAPAAAVVAVAAVSILATSGVFGGNEEQPPVDTGIAPKRTQVEVPEAEPGSIVAELRQAADAARRERLADKQGSAPAPTAPPATEAEPDEAPAPDQAPAPEDEAPAPDADEGTQGGQGPDGGPDGPPEDEAPAGDAPAGAAP